METKEKLSLNQVHRLVNFSPLVLVTVAYGDRQTIAPIAWYTVLSARPPMIGLAVGQSHLTHLLITRSGEFALNIPSSKLLKTVIYCGTTSGENEDKFAGAHLTVVRAEQIGAPLIAECFANLECFVKDKFSVNDHTFFIGTVVAARIQKGFFKPGNILDIKKARTLHHLGGQHFAELGEELTVL